MVGRRRWRRSGGTQGSTRHAVVPPHCVGSSSAAPCGHAREGGVCRRTERHVPHCFPCEKTLMKTVARSDSLHTVSFPKLYPPYLLKLLQFGFQEVGVQVGAVHCVKQTGVCVFAFNSTAWNGLYQLSASEKGKWNVNICLIKILFVTDCCCTKLKVAFLSSTSLESRMFETRQKHFTIFCHRWTNLRICIENTHCSVKGPSFSSFTVVERLLSTINKQKISIKQCV